MYRLTSIAKSVLRDLQTHSLQLTLLLTGSAIPGTIRGSLTRTIFVFRKCNFCIKTKKIGIWPRNIPHFGSLMCMRDGG